MRPPVADQQQAATAASATTEIGFVTKTSQSDLILTGISNLFFTGNGLFQGSDSLSLIELIATCLPGRGPTAADLRPLAVAGGLVGGLPG